MMTMRRWRKHEDNFDNGDDIKVDDDNDDDDNSEVVDDDNDDADDDLLGSHVDFDLEFHYDIKNYCG